MKRNWLAVVVEPRVDNRDVHNQISLLILLIFPSLVTSYLDLPLHGSHGSAR